MTEEEKKIIAAIGDSSKLLVRLFFKACGFGDDILGATTMMYSRKASTYHEGDQIIIRAGRKLLIPPPLPEPPAF